VFLKYFSQRRVHNSLTVEWERRNVNPQPWFFTNNSLGLPHAPSLSVCLFLWVCVVCVCFLLYLSFYLCCGRCVFCVLFHVHNTFLYEFNRHLCHGAYWCTHNPARMSILLFHLHLRFSNPCVCVCQRVYVFPSSSIFIHTNRHIHMYPYSYVWFVFYSIFRPMICFLPSDSTNLIDTYVTVSIDVRSTLLYT